jgi:hypothetical protein
MIIRNIGLERASEGNQKQTELASHEQGSETRSNSEPWYMNRNKLIKRAIHVDRKQYISAIYILYRNYKRLREYYEF